MPNTPEQLRAILEEIIATETGNDFITFEIKNVAPIAVAKKYAGIGASLVARIKNTKTPFGIDFGVGDVIGLRGPYGKGFPYRSFAGRDVLVVGSGVGLAPVRTIIVRLLQERERYGRIAIIASATRYEGLVYKQDLKDWSKIPGVTVQYALAKPTDAVQAHVGYINDLLPELDFDWANARAILCASPRRIKLVARDLLGLGMNGKDIFTSLETHMRCGVGKCGHCKVGAHYMCLDGPVFTYEEMLQLPEEF